MAHRSRRQFLGDVGTGALAATVGVGALSSAFPRSASDEGERLDLGPHAALVAAMQELEPDRLLGRLAREIREGRTLQDLAAAGALANTESLGGTDYVGYHAFMALRPAFSLSTQAQADGAGLASALPLLKVLYRNASRIQEAGAGPAMSPVAPADDSSVEDLVKHERAASMVQAEATFKGMAQRSIDEAYEALGHVVRDTLDVHQVVLSWRAWDMRELAGDDFGEPLLRQAMRQCVHREASRRRRGRPEPGIRRALPRILDESGVVRREPGRKAVDDGQLTALVKVVFGASPDDAAGAVAEALAAGFDPEQVGEALSLASLELLLRDPGRSKGEPGKPKGSVHGASVGVHAIDSANAWRQLARVGSWHHRASSLITGAYHTAGQSGRSSDHEIASDDDALEAAFDRSKAIEAIDDAIRQGDQVVACAWARRYLAADGPRPELDRLLRDHALEADGALHAEKFCATALEELQFVRAAHQDRFRVGLVRVSASQAGFEAPGLALARRLLG